MSRTLTSGTVGCVVCGEPAEYVLMGSPRAPEVEFVGTSCCCPERRCVNEQAYWEDMWVAAIEQAETDARERRIDALTRY